ncbi:MAG: hypothetical protein HY084_08570 [Gemmatimonadetes bacterium]|nr:hypothetical protein [Gemmatimonadota bacterium]
MTAPGGPQKIIQSRPRRVQLVLRDAEVVRGGVFLNEGQSLGPYLGSRKGGWVNVVNAEWVGQEETSNHAVIQADHILLATSLDGDIPVYGATAAPTPREVILALEDGSRLRGVLHLAEKQRLSDYLSACGRFIPLLEAARSPRDGTSGDVAVNAAAVRTIKDAKVFAPGAMEAAADAGGEPKPAAPAPVNREVVQRESGTLEVLTAGRVPDRRAPRAEPLIAHHTPPLVVTPSPGPELTPEQRELNAWLARHWLVQLGAGAQLLPPDPRTLPASPSLEEVWHALATCNEMADAELGVHVAAGFKLPVADLDDVMALALHEVPERIARKLNALPLRTDGKVLTLAVADPSSMEIEQQVGFVTRQRLQFEIAPPAEIRGAIDWHYAQAAPAS